MSAHAAGPDRPLKTELSHERACERIGKYSASANADSERQRGVLMSEEIGIVVADDHEVVRAGFAALLDTQPDFTVLGTASDGAGAVLACQELKPDVVLMDVRMPGTDGI